MYHLKREVEGDWWEVEALYDLCFAPGREALSSYRHGWNRVMLVGDEPYYKRFGFNILPGVHMPPPTNPNRVLGMALVPGTWAGVTGHVRVAPNF